jgi:hypothetical protein
MIDELAQLAPVFLSKRLGRLDHIMPG